MNPTCGECERPLKDPDSIARGYGPVCWRGHTDAHTMRIPARRHSLPEDQPITGFPEIPRTTRKEHHSE